MTFGRIKKKPAEDYVRHILTPRLEDYKPQFNVQMLVHRAHVVMLYEQEIIQKEEAAQILVGLSEIEKKGLNGLKLEPHSDLYMTTEKKLIELVGDLGGKMHIGRSRNDLSATSTRMYVREKISEVIESFIEFRKALLNLSEEHIETLMPGYTHWQQAQPVVLAHYLLAHADSVERSISRLQNAYRNTNLSPLGAAALAGTGFPIDRLRTAELLGFDGLLENSYDAIATRDFIAETTSAIAIYTCELSRIAEDLIIWATNEFSMVELSEEYAGTSSIMPQKKNPISLEMIRAKSGHVIGDLMTVLSILKGIPYTNVGDWSELCSAFNSAVDLTIGATCVMKGILSTLKVNKDIMFERVSRGFSTTTELADHIVREKDLPFRVAHEIVSKVVVKALYEGISSTEINAEMIDEASLIITGEALNLSDTAVKMALDPIKNIKKRCSTGGPATVEVERMLAERQRKLSEDDAMLGSMKETLKQINLRITSIEKGILN